MIRVVVEHYTSDSKSPPRRAGVDGAVDSWSPAGPTASVGGPTASVGGPAASVGGPAGPQAPAPESNPFVPIPEHLERSPLSLRRSTPRRLGLADDPSLAAAPVRSGARSMPPPTSRRDLVLGPAFLGSSTERRRQALPLGAVLMALLLALAAVAGSYWYRHRPGPHGSPVDVTEAFITALYDNAPRVAQSMIVPGERLDVQSHPKVPISFGAVSATGSGAIRTVNIIVCITPGGQGCGSQSGNGTSVVVPTQEVRGLWYVDENLMVACGGQPTSSEVLICQG
jgi:hypothetical protein